MEKPIIGVTPLWDEEKKSYWMLPGYLEGVKEAGAIPVILPLTTNGADIAQLADLCDGFLFTGGQDVDPQLYGEAMEPFCGELCPARDALEQELLRQALERDKPILGICRGIQFLNAALGGTLYQDLPTEHPSEIGHELEAAIAGNIYPTLCNARSVQQLVADGIAFGKTGQKARQGLYIWSESDLEDFRDRLQRPFFTQVREWELPTGTSDQ